MYTLNLKEPIKVQELKEESPFKYSFKKFLSERILDEEHYEFLTEEEKVQSNTKGVLHELLVGYHLNGKNHLDKHPDVFGDSPKQAHDRLKKTVTPEQYRMMNDRAEAAANDIRGKLKGEIHSIHWTSKHGDIERTTGIKSTQKEDDSDIIVSTRHQNKILHHGISLKVTDGRAAVPVSNPGLESTYGGDEILEKHRKALKEKFPVLNKLTSADDRKTEMLFRPRMEQHVKEQNKKVLNDIADHLDNKLSQMSREEFVHHIRTHVLHAFATPMEKLGHVHIRHTTHGKNKFTFRSHAPSEDHEEILNDPDNITHEKSGTGVVFKHKGKIFARHRLKFTSQSDPLSSVKGSGSYN